MYKHFYLYFSVMYLVSFDILGFFQKCEMHKRIALKENINKYYMHLYR